MAGLCTYPLITQLCETPTHSHTTYTHTIALYPVPTSIMTSRAEVGMEVASDWLQGYTHSHSAHSPHPFTTPTHTLAIRPPTHSTHSPHPLTPPTHPTHSHPPTWQYLWPLPTDRPEVTGSLCHVRVLPHSSCTCG